MISLLPPTKPSSFSSRFPAQDHVGGDSKIPSILYYNQDGELRAVGAEALQENVIEQAEEEGWTKSEWFCCFLVSMLTRDNLYTIQVEASSPPERFSYFSR
jgi:hypothetical protein